MLEQLDTWHRTKVGHLVVACIEALCAYGFGSLAIDRGNLWWYIFSIIFVVGVLQNVVLLMTKLVSLR